jgi:glycosyltransferase involved in cell wall biosynthesis
VKLLVDMQSIQAGSAKGGIGRYSLNLLEYMIKNNKNIKFSLLLNANLSMDYYEYLTTLVPKENIYNFYGYKETQERFEENRTKSEISQLIRELVISLINPDIVFVTSLVEGYLDNVVVSIGKIFPSQRSSVILYDLIPYVQQEKYLSNPLAKKHYFEKIEQLSKSELILSISEYSKKEGLEFLDTKNIVNISSGVNEKFKKVLVTSDEKNQLKQKYSLEENIILYVSSYDVRKNQSSLIEAFSLLPNDIKEKYQLVLIGNGPKSIIDTLKKQAIDLGIETNVKFLGFISDEDLLKIYSISSLFVFPSLFEGFGLPALEAMRCEIPTIGSKSTSIIEVINMKEALFNPTNIKQISDLILKSLTNENFKVKLLQNAKEQSKKFSWDITANIALDNLLELKTSLAVTKNYVENFFNSYNIFLEKLKQIDELQNYSQEQLIELSYLIEKNINKYKRKIGVISTWNTRCGIASYTKYLTKCFFDDSVILAPYTAAKNMTQEDEPNTLRCWQLSNDNLDELYNKIISLQLEKILIQFNYGFFNFYSLNSFLDRLFALNIEVSITFHSTTDIKDEDDKKLFIIKDRLSRCKNIFIHTKKDEINLNKLNLKNNIILLPQGIIDISNDEQKTEKVSNEKFILATYGFFLESKGFLNMIDCFNILKQKGLNIKLKMYNAKYNDEASNHLIAQAQEKISNYNLENYIDLNTDYCSDEYSIEELSKTNLVVYPYLKTGESSSAAVRMAIAAKTNIAVTPQSIFDELSEFVFIMPGDSVEDLVKGLEDTILTIQNDKEKIDNMKIKMLEFREKNLYTKMSNNIKGLL